MFSDGTKISRIQDQSGFAIEMFGHVPVNVGRQERWGEQAFFKLLMSFLQQIEPPLLFQECIDYDINLQIGVLDGVVKLKAEALICT